MADNMTLGSGGRIVYHSPDKQRDSEEQTAKGAELKKTSCNWWDAPKTTNKAASPSSTSTKWWGKKTKRDKSPTKSPPSSPHTSDSHRSGATQNGENYSGIFRYRRESESGRSNENCRNYQNSPLHSPRNQNNSLLMGANLNSDRETRLRNLSLSSPKRAAPPTPQGTLGSPRGSIQSPTDHHHMHPLLSSPSKLQTKQGNPLNRVPKPGRKSPLQESSTKVAEKKKSPLGKLALNLNNLLARGPKTPGEATKRESEQIDQPKELKHIERAQMARKNGRKKKRSKPKFVSAPAAGASSPVPAIASEVSLLNNARTHASPRSSSRHSFSVDTSAPTTSALSNHLSFSKCARPGNPITKPRAYSSPPAASVFSKRVEPCSSTPSDSTSSTLDLPSLFEQFYTANTVQDTLKAFETFKTQLLPSSSAKSAVSGDLFDLMKPLFFSASPNDRLKRMWKMLDKARLVHGSYPRELQGIHVVVVGAGIAGLRFALEAAMKGAEVTVLEKYADFVRRNVIIIWNDTKKDLQALIPTDLLQLSRGNFQTIPIKMAQRALFKACMMLGVTFHINTYFYSFSRSVDAVPFTVSARRTKRHAQPGQPLRMPCHILVGASGAGDGSVAEAAEITMKETAGVRGAVGITANFALRPEDQPQQQEPGGRRHTTVSTEQSYALPKHRRELGLLQKHLGGIELEVVNYFKAPTHHYIVASPKWQTLEDHGMTLTVEEADLRGLNVEERLRLEMTSRSKNPRLFTKKEKIQALALKIGQHQHILGSNATLLRNPLNPKEPDVSIFDFSVVRVAEQGAKFFPGDEVSRGPPLLAILVGDCAMSSYWPHGTGANKALLWSLHAVQNLVAPYVKHFKTASLQRKQASTLVTSKGLSRLVDRFNKEFCSMKRCTDEGEYRKNWSKQVHLAGQQPKRRLGN